MMLYYCGVNQAPQSRRSRPNKSLMIVPRIKYLSCRKTDESRYLYVIEIYSRLVSVIV